MREFRTVVSALTLVACAGVAHAQTPCAGAAGPDVIVGDITGPSNYSIDAAKQTRRVLPGHHLVQHGTGRTFMWISNNNQHPSSAVPCTR
jgi:hypothetical protein